MCGIFFVKTAIHSKEVLEKSFNKASYRGPDDTKFIYFPKLSDELNYNIGFHRLAINGLNDESNQPFYKEGVDLICNG